MHEASVSLEGSVQAKVAFVCSLRASSSIWASVSTFHDIPQALVVQTFECAIHRLARPQSSLVISIRRGRLERAL